MNIKLDVDSAWRFYSNGLPALTPEHSFHPVRKWKFDRACLPAKVAVEIEGGVFGFGPKCPACGRRQGGAHGTGKQIMRDIEKYNQAAALGWLVFRATPEMIGEATTAMLFVRMVASAINARTQPIRPTSDDT